MSSLSTVEAKLPPGFRFHPRDEELICDYLMKWIAGCAHPFPILIEVDLNKCEPWDIPVTARVGGKEWYFYCQRDRKYATGLRTNRATISGYWKATGKDRPVIRKRMLVGMRKTLVFYVGRAPKGRKTEWVMHEFRIEGIRGPEPKPVSLAKEDWVLCRVFYKSRQEIPGGKSQLESTENSYMSYSYDVVAPSSPSLPPLITEPPPPPPPPPGPPPYSTNITFNQTQYHHHHEQVPCFSIFNTNQTSPNTSTFSLITHTVEPPPPPPNFADLYNNPPLVMMNNRPSSCDKKVIRDVLNRLTKIESGINNEQCSMIMGSSSFGHEGSSDSYLSEVGLSSMWNQY